MGTPERRLPGAAGALMQLAFSESEALGTLSALLGVPWAHIMSQDSGTQKHEASC